VGIDELAGRLHPAGVRFAETTGELIAGKVPTHGPIPAVPGSSVKYPPGWKSAVLYSYFEDGPGMIELCEPSAHHPGMKERRSGPPRRRPPGGIPAGSRDARNSGGGPGRRGGSRFGFTTTVMADLERS
jgi:hypothetical protein